MTAQDRRDEVWARRVEWGLRAVLGDERAPDVTQAVLARHAAGDQPEVEDRLRARTTGRPWLVAALMLLGLGVVVAVSRLEQPPSVPTVGQAPGAELVTVTSLEGIAALPPSTRAVELIDLGDEAVGALVVRCPQLQHLRLFASTCYRRPDSPAEPVSITDAALPHVAKLGSLRRLELDGTDGVEGWGLRHLDALPLLETLTLSRFDLDDADLQFLPRLPSLRALDLTLNQGFGRPDERSTDSAGVAAIARCAGLQRLSLYGCGHLHTDALRRLAELRGLIALDLGGGQSFRGYGAPSRRTQSVESAAAMAEARDRFGAGVTDEVIAAWPRLRELRLQHATRLTPAVGKRIRELCPRLVLLDLSDCTGIDDSTVAQVVRLAKLRTLDLSRCPGVTAAVLPALRSSSLSAVVFDETPWLALAHAETLFRSGKRVRSARRDDHTGFAAGLRALAEKHAGRLAPRQEQVHTLADIAALPDEVTEIEVRGLGDDAAEQLARLRSLQRVAFVRSEGRMPLTDAGLAALARLPRLQALELVGTDATGAEGVRHLLDCRWLESLRCVDTELDDRAFQLLPAMPSLCQLDLTGCRRLGARGMAALSNCRGLRDLSLVGCAQLRSDDIAQLGRLTALTRLDLTRVGSGVDDRALAALRALGGELRELRLGAAHITAVGAPALGAMASLTTLDLSDNVLLAAEALRHLPPSLEVLHLDRCVGLDAGTGQILRETLPALRVLSVSGSDWLDDDGLAAILALPRLERLDVGGCVRPTSRSLPRIAGARALRELDASRCAWMPDDAAAELVRVRPELELIRRVW